MIYNPNPRSNPNCIACIFSMLKNWGVWGCPLDGVVFHIFISKLLKTVSPLTYLINLVTIDLLLQFVMDLWRAAFEFLKWPPYSQNSIFFLKLRNCAVPE